MNSLQFVCLAFVLTLLSPNLSFGAHTKLQHANNTQLVIELAIVADKDFGDIFNQNRTQFLDYWAKYIQDLNDLFSSLSTIQLSARITSATIFGTITDNFQNDKNEIGPESLVAPFAEWVHGNREIFPEFDVAVLVSGSPVRTPIAGIARRSGACRSNRSVAVIKDRGIWNVEIMAHELGHLLGVGHDDDLEGCAGHIMMSQFETRKISPEKFKFFSTCTEQSMAKFLESSQAECLKKIDLTNGKFLASADLTSHSMDNQCKREFKTEDAVASKTSTCVAMKCVVGNQLIGDLCPAEQSICKTQNQDIGTCYKGSCLPVIIEENNILKTTSEVICQWFVYQNVNVTVCRNIFTSFILKLENVSNRKRVLVLPYTDFSRGTNGNHTDCFGAVDRRVPLLLYPCPRDIPLEVQDFFEQAGLQLEETHFEVCTNIIYGSKGGMVVNRVCKPKPGEKSVSLLPGVILEVVALVVIIIMYAIVRNLSNKIKKMINETQKVVKKVKATNVVV